MTEQITISKKTAIIVGVLLFFLLATVTGGGIAYMLTRNPSRAGEPATVSAPITSNSPSGRIKYLLDAANRTDPDAFLSVFTPQLQQQLRAALMYNAGSVADQCRKMSHNGTIVNVEVYDETIIGTIARVRIIMRYSDGTTAYDVYCLAIENGNWYIDTNPNAAAAFSVSTDIFSELQAQARQGAGL